MLQRLLSRFFSQCHYRSTRVLKMMHGYRILKKAGRLSFLAKVNHTLTITPLGLTPELFSPILFGESLESGELALRQYLLVRIGGLDLNAALLIALATPENGVTFPLPLPWRRIIESHGIKVNHWKSAVLWAGYIGALFVYGCVRIIRTCWNSVHQNDSTPDENYVYFAGLAPENLPKNPEATLPNYDVISWYLQWSHRNKDVPCIRHSAPVEQTFQKSGIWIRVQPEPLPTLSGKAMLRYFAWSIKAMTVALLDMCRGRWWHAFLLNQAELAAQARFAREAKLAREYFFHNSGVRYRPLWTYELEKRGIRTWLYFYSVSDEPLKTKTEDFYEPYAYMAINWPRYIVWDSQQKKVIERVAQVHPEIIEAGEVWFSDNGQSVPLNDRPMIGLFDVTPRRASRYVIAGAVVEYNVPDVINRFIDDVLSCSIEHGYKVAWKQKRNIGKGVHPLHRNYIKAIANHKELIMIDPDMAAAKLIEACHIVISLPFTTTAVIARNHGKPSAFYDPTGLIQTDDPAARGIPVLKGKDELRAWICKHSQETTNKNMMPPVLIRFSAEE